MHITLRNYYCSIYFDIMQQKNTAVPPAEQRKTAPIVFFEHISSNGSFLLGAPARNTGDERHIALR